MMTMIPRLLLFDIDGTLVKSDHKKVGKYFGSSLLEALSVAFQKEINRNGIHFAGERMLFALFNEVDRQ